MSIAAEKFRWLRQLETIEIPVYRHGEVLCFAQVDGDYDGEYLGSFHWSLNTAGYVYRRGIPGLGENRNATIFLHHLVLPYRRGLERDHINQNKLDNHSCNLRHVTRKQNTWNRRMSQSFKSRTGYIGVYAHGDKFAARLAGQYLGVYETAEYAARVYDRAAMAERGEFAVLNFT